MVKIKKRVRRWLGIASWEKELEDTKDSLVEDARKTLKDEIDHFTRTFSKIGEITCTRCGKKVVTYPFGGGYYRESDGAVICSNECLDASVKAEGVIKHGH